MKHVSTTGLMPGAAILAQPMLNARARGIYGTRLDASDATKVLAELKKTFEDFKAERDKEIADLKKGLGDVVQTEKVDRINAEITKLQGSIDEVNALVAALRVGGSGDGDKLNADEKAHAKAFNAYFRKGVEAGLKDLEVKAAATTDNDPNGGYLVDKQTEQTVDRVLQTVSAIRSIASVLTISASVYQKLVGQGGATGGWVGEKQSRPETNTPTLAALSFPAMELYANPAATQTMLDDARIDIASWLGDEVSMTFADKEGLAFYSGDGVNQPRGISSYTMVADASYAWGKVGYTVSGVAAALSDSTHSGHDALTDLVYAIRQGYRNNARFLMNRKTQAAIAATAEIVFDGTVPYQDDADTDPRSVILNGQFLPVTSYEVRGQFIPESDRDTTWSAWLPVTTPDTRVSESELSAALNALLQQLDVTREAAIRPVLDALQAQVDQLQQSTSGMVALLNDRIEGSIINYIGQRYGDAVSEITDVRTIADGLADLFINVFVGNTVESGNALFRMTVVDPPDGIVTRIQLEARATAEDDFAATGVMFDAGVTALGGKPQITFYAQVVSGDPVPVMQITDGEVRIIGAKLVVTDGSFAPAAAFSGSFIEDLTVNTLAIAQGAVLAAAPSTPSNPSHSSLTTSGGAYDSNYETIASFTVDVNEFTEFVRTDMILSEVQINWGGSGTVAYQIRLRLLRDGTDVVWPPSGTPYSILSSTRATDLAQVNPFAWIDFPDDEGSHTYEWQIRVNCSGAITSGTGSWSAGPVNAAVQVPKNQI